MHKLAEVVMKVAEKYTSNIDLVIAGNKLIADYIIIRNNEKETYKTLEIEEVENKLRITVLPERIVKVTDLEGLEDIILILNKQSSAKEHTQEEIQQIKEKYVAGLKVELIKMYDLQAPPPNTRGFIDYVDDIGTLHIKWATGSSLGLVVGVDKFKIICPLCNQELEVF